MKIIFDNEHQKTAFLQTISGKCGCPSLFGLKNVDNFECGMIGACKRCWDAAVQTAVIPAEEDSVPECMDGILKKFMEVL